MGAITVLKQKKAFCIKQPSIQNSTASTYKNIIKHANLQQDQLKK
jgi:hypothetical protein